MRSRSANRLVGVVALFLGPMAWADDKAGGAAAQVDAVVVTGTRAPDRTALHSSSPVDVITSETLNATGYADLGRALEFSEPSVNYPRPQTTPSSANTRPITLRGLSPDEVLVLVNGKRWHTSAVINVNFAVGRGSAPFDLSTIPIAAVDRIEILRDSAAAQYGSDAIAGVINIILKSNATGGSAQLQGGVTERGDGDNIDGGFNRGFRFGDGGRLSLSGEAGYQNTTNRAAVDQRFGRTTYLIGDPRVSYETLAASAIAPVLAKTVTLYDDLDVSHKDSSNAVGFRPPSSTLPQYPNGFLPIVNPELWDVGNSFGTRFKGWQDLAFDLSNTIGYSNAQFDVGDTANVSLGADSPTQFDSGTVSYLQDTSNLLIDRALPDVLAGANFAAGVEFRYESYRIENGESASIVGSGANGFPGFNPHIPVDASRTAEAGFVDLELKPVDWLRLGAAGRYDHYSDFGGAATWKASFRAECTRWLALRGSASTGFRAPSLQQEYYSSITTVANGAGGSLVNVGTFEVADPVAQALGAVPLKAEKSHDYSIGFVLTPLRNLSLTADFFRTDINNRIALSDALSGAAVTTALSNAGITNVQQVAFFTNALSTRTQGYDVTGKYHGNIDEATDFSVAVAYDRSPTSVRNLNQNAVVPSLPLIGAHARLLLTEAQPRSKLSGGFTLYHGPYTGVVKATHFGSYTDAPIRDPQTFAAKTIIDLSVAARLYRSLTLVFGVLNVGDIYPERLAETELAPSFGGSYVYGEESPWGVDGRSYYARLDLKL